MLAIRGRAWAARKFLLQKAEIGCSQSRGLQLFDIFNKEKAKERQEKLKDETSRGYFDDFKQLRDSKGKLFEADSGLVPPQKAQLVPSSELLRPDSSSTSLVAEASRKKATLLCLAFRSGAEDLLASWSQPFGKTYSREDCQHIELSLVDSVVMTWWPFRNAILRGTSPQAEASGLPPVYLFNFGNAEQYFETFRLSNRLTGYVFLIDGQGRLRWRACGMASVDEEQTMLACVEELLRE